jgi:Zn-dependent protease with chaperone function
MAEVKGTFFDGVRSKGWPGTVRVLHQDKETLLVISTRDGGDRNYPVSACRFTPSVGRTARHIECPDGARFESVDCSGIALLEDQLGVGRRWQLIHRLEDAWPFALAAAVVAVLSAWSVYTYFVPWAAKRVAMSLPAEAHRALGRDAFPVVELLLDLQPSRVPPDRQQALQQSFAEVAATLAPPSVPLTLHFRDAAELANALALPSGDIIVTDALVEAADDDREIAAVLAHEIGHVIERHSVRRVLEDAGMFVVLGAIVGDITSVTSLSAAVPTLVASANYSRAAEREADLIAADYCVKRGWDPRLLATILVKIAGQPDEIDVPQLASSHPSLAERVKVLDEIAKKRGF